MQQLITSEVDIQHCLCIDDKRQEILDYFLKTWEIDELTWKPLKDDSVFYLKGDPLRHDIIFYYGHTASFYINKLVISKVIKTRINSEMESIFAIGVDEMSWDDLNSKHYNWPKVEDVRVFRNKVKELVVNLIKTLPLQVPITWDNPFWIIMMGIEHTRIHLETSSVLIRQLPIEDVVPNRFGPIYNNQSRNLTDLNDLKNKLPQNELISVKGGTVKLGKSLNDPLYGWDNEYGELVQEVKDFKASKYLVSNGEFLDFVKDNGYNTKEFWTEEGWHWKNFKKAEMPLFWIKKSEEDYRLRLIDVEIPMPWNWPVELNYLEAKAFCNWKCKKTGKKIRMPTEAEWCRLHEYAEVPDLLDWWKKKGGPGGAPGNINLEYYVSACPVDEFKTNPKYDFYDIIGNVWQWSETSITGFPGFKVHPAYDDFTMPTIDGKHNLIKGGSFISTGNEAIYKSRYAFRRHFYQHAGFRYVEADSVEVEQHYIGECETDPEVVESCEFNWGKKDDAFDVSLCKKILEITKDYSNKNNEHKFNRVLDLNSDTGRLPFELARTFEDITALDLSARFIRVSISLQEKCFAQYAMKDDGELVIYHDIYLKDYGFDEKDENLRKRILFMQADPNNIKSLYTGYDLVIIPNLLEEIAYPDKLLETIHERMNDKSLLIIASTYNWNTEKTPREHWVGGFKKDGENYTSFDGISDILSKNFEQFGTPFDISFTLKKSSRISELRITQVSAWAKK